MNTTMVFDSRVFPYRENDTMEHGDLPCFKRNFMKTRISNIAKTDPVLPCEFHVIHLLSLQNTAYLRKMRYAILANGALPRY